MANNAKTEATVSELLDKLRSEYLSRLPAELAAINALAAGVQPQAVDAASMDELHRRLHKLAGSGGTFGYTLLSTRARSLEQQLKRWQETNFAALDQAACEGLQRESGLLAEAMQLPDHATPALEQESLPERAEPQYKVWLLADNEQLTRDLTRQLESFNYFVRVYAQLADADKAAQAEQPDLLLAELLVGGQDVTRELPHYAQLQQLPCPLIFIASGDDFDSRLRASQLGAQGYFLMPLDVPLLISRMAQLFEQHEAPPQRVLIVDDDLALAEHYRLVLQEAGIEAEVLQRPEEIIEKISAQRPELILMDMHMPQYSGPDLAGVIRQYHNWASLPLVYLSAETDIDIQNKALKRGADDFLTKPISDAQLVSAVRIRIERARQLHAQLVRDSLTGLLKHSSIKEAVEQEVLRAQRSGRAVTLAMLDIDHFKQVNDTYGHAVGDVVITAVAMLLRQRLRQSDIVGRYGGEEFVAILLECGIEHGRELLDDIRRRFAEVNFCHAGSDFHCTLSAGIASTLQFKSSDGAALLAAADAALYEAKRAGRNQVHSAGLEVLTVEVDKP